MILQTNNIFDETISEQLETIWNQVTQEKPPGFIRILKDESNWSESKKWGENLKSKYQRLVLLGIGGSSMGARALANYKFSEKVLFLDNIDPSEVLHVWNTIKSDLKNTGFVIISKSGESLEITALMEFFCKKSSEMNHDFFANSFIISEDKKSLLTDFAEEKKVPVIPMPIDVGGRFSVLTTVGMVLAHFMGFDLEAIRRGALAVLTKKTETLQLSTELALSVKNEFDLFIFWSYSSQLRWFNQWLNQLWAESLGKAKRVNNTKAPKVPWIVSCTGCSDQHSVYQHILESEQKKYVLLTQSLEDFAEISFEKPHLTFFKNRPFKIREIMSAERDATAQALKQYGIPVSQMLFEKYDDETIGFLFVYFEVITSVMGHYLDINPYDQPAVQLGKRIALENLRLN